MTNKTLSQELAELAKIEPQTTGILSCTSWKVQNIKDCSECKYECEDKKPPDFENDNNNFVRLLEFCQKHFYAVKFTGYCYLHNCSIQETGKNPISEIGLKGSLLDSLITVFKRNSIEHKERLEDLKQALQSEKWRY